MDTVLENVVLGYKEALHFTENDSDDSQYGITEDSEFADETLEKILSDCNKAIIYANSLKENELNVKNAVSFGHDLWLTRNGHGAGFWDGDWKEEFGEKMTEFCHKLGQVWVYSDENDLIYCS